ncbi:N-acetylmuramoyl-L-alanine amidase [Neisseria zoodegmatis]|uniref:N-acetylmuramoyl-L-alanine amidase n=1 Tax=Neisseria zoodegmatis TaxID=326523 RepID=A0AB38DRJ3_9NEIS|nr:N-acetylmuramoyl-L-alanine amidase [Neisseria zoodegmatis]OSI11559.1 hypothetical protein BWD10_00905 [Neisseria zoodegmatis]SNU79889.1 N-acetylmuramoyl-L-alanine amidase [Neisseria zoodegmatis]
MKDQIFSIICFLLLSLNAWATENPLLVLDSGHTPKHGGALGIKGQYEVVYNDQFVSKLQPELEKAGWKVMLTRLPEQEIGLSERAALANKNGAVIFLSIHHDSAQLKYLQEVEHNGQKVYQTTRPIRGYSLFVSGKNPEFIKSQKLAASIGKELRGLGRVPTLHHAEPIAGENRLLLDKTNGVYRYDELAVLRQTTMPAVLLEIGVIVDKQDEAYISQTENQRAMINAIVRALQPYQHF